MTIDGEYEPSTQKWVRHQVELYESSGGRKGTTWRGLPVIILTTERQQVRKSALMRVEHDGKYYQAKTEREIPVFVREEREKGGAGV